MNTTDLTRKIGVTVAEILCIVGTLVGVGVIGTRVEESSGGALAADATLLAPAGPAFSIWSVIYLGLAAYTVWQWLPGPGSSELARRTGWWVAASMILNAAWLLVTQQGWIWVSVLVIIALLVVLARLALELAAASEGAADTFGTWLVRITVGLYLGWVAVATFANIAAALGSTGADVSTGAAVLGALVALVVVTSVAVTLMRSERTRWSVAAAVVWGLSWLAVGRLSDESRSTAVGIGALVAVAVVAASAVLLSAPGRNGRSGWSGRSAERSA